MNNHHHCPEFNALATSKFLALQSVITCQWLDMFLHCWTPVQEHCMVCGFSGLMVFTKTVWTKCSAVRYWPRCCMQVLHGQASVLQQTTANSTDVYRCQQLNQDISEFRLADQALFSSLQKNSHHVLHRAKSTQPYNLRPRRQFFPYSKTIHLRWL